VQIEHAVDWVLMNWFIIGIHLSKR
jgi:hypothetical protein